MSTIVYLIVLLGVYSVVFVVKQLTAKHDDVKGTPLGGEVFPNIEVYNSEEPEEQKAYPAYQKPQDTPKPTVKPDAAHEKKYTPIATATELLTEEKSKEKISLKSRSEAKRAFIHAEILKRKY